MKKNLKVLQEEISDCGVCSLLSIIKYYGGNANLEKLRIDTNTTNKGVTAFNLIECAKSYGFDAKGLRVNSFDNLVFPFIAHLNINKSLSHFVVVYKVLNDKVTIMDPASGFKNISLKEFNELFTGIVIELIPKITLKNEDSSNILLKKIKELFKSNWRKLLFIILLNLVFICLSIISSFYIDFVYSTYNYKLLFIIFFIITILTSLFEYLLNINSEKLKVLVGKCLLDDFFKHIFNLPLKYIHMKDSGEIIKRVNDLESIKDVLINSFVVIFTNVLILFFIFILIYSIIKPIFFILILFSFIYILSSILLYKNVTTKLSEVISRSTLYNSKLQDFILGLTSIKHSNTKDLFLGSLYTFKNNNLDSLYDYERYVLKINGILSSLFQILVLIIYTIIFIKIKEKLLTINIIIILSLLINMIYKSLNEITNLVPGIYYVKAILNKIDNFYLIEEENNNYLLLDDYSIDVKDLSFSYNKFKNVINNFNSRINWGEKVIIKGESGKGKSTFCKLISKEYDNYRGTIKIGNKELKDIKNISGLIYSSQEEYIFNGTIKDNILMGRNVSEDRFNKIASICLLDRIIKNRPFKYDTYLYDGGKELSGGERNLVILARTLISDGYVYILDETLAEVNDKVEDEIIKNIFDYFNDKTIIYVSHKNKKNYFKRTIYM